MNNLQLLGSKTCVLLHRLRMSPRVIKRVCPVLPCLDKAPSRTARLALTYLLNSAAVKFLSVVLVLLLTIPLQLAQAGTSCKCVQHKAEAEARGTCSRTEDSSYCTLKFDATPLLYREAFVKFLDEVQDSIDVRVPISTDIDAVLDFAFLTLPSQWTENDIRQYLPVLFAISQRSIFAGRNSRPGLDSSSYPFRETTFAVAAFIDRAAPKLVGPWTDDMTLGTEVEYRSMDRDVEAAISFGCIQLRFSNGVETMVKTKFSLGGYDCTDTDPSLYH